MLLFKRKEKVEKIELKRGEYILVKDKKTNEKRIHYITDQWSNLFDAWSYDHNSEVFCGRDYTKTRIEWNFSTGKPLSDQFEYLRHLTDENAFLLIGKNSEIENLKKNKSIDESIIIAKQYLITELQKRIDGMQELFNERNARIKDLEEYQDSVTKAVADFDPSFKKMVSEYDRILVLYNKLVDDFNEFAEVSDKREACLEDVIRELCLKLDKKKEKRK